MTWGDCCGVEVEEVWDEVRVDELRQDEDWGGGELWWRQTNYGMLRRRLVNERLSVS